MNKTSIVNISSLPAIIVRSQIQSASFGNVLKVLPILPKPGPTFERVVAAVEKAVVISNPQPSNASHAAAKINMYTEI